MTASYYEKIADRLVQEVVCHYGRCLVCGDTLSVGGHHLVKKSQCHGSRYWMRHDPRNLVPLCVRCHGYAHAKQKEFEQWLEENKPEIWKWHVNQLAVPLVQGPSTRTIEQLRTTIKTLKLLGSHLS